MPLLKERPAQLQLQSRLRRRGVILEPGKKPTFWVMQRICLMWLIVPGTGSPQA